MSEAMDALVARVERQLGQMRDLGARMAEIRVRETSVDGVVTVEVDGNGTLCDLRFTGGIATMSPAEFERAVTSTAHRAAAAAFDRRAALSTEFATDSPTR